MPTEHTIPSTTRVPGVFNEFDLLSAAQGLTPIEARVLGVGVKTAGGTAADDEPVQVFSESDADSKFGQGSEAALMARKALEVGARKGVQPEVWIGPIADPAGTPAVFKITIGAGTADEAADVVFRVAGRTLRAGVSKNDDQDAVALAIVDAVAARQAKRGDLPVTAAVDGVNANEVNLTAIVTGVNGNDIAVTVEDVGLSGLTVTAAVSTAGVGVADPTDALAASLAKYYECKALANHAAADIAILDAHLDAAWAPASKRWCFTFVAETGTLGTASTHAAAANDWRQHVFSYEGSPSLPCEIAMAEATAVALRSRPNYNWDGDELPLFAPPEGSIYNSVEQESALSSGVVPLVPNDARTATQTVRMINTLTTVNSAPAPEEIRDLAPIRGMLAVTRDLDAVYRVKFGGVNKSADVIKQMRSVAYTRFKTWEATPLSVLQNVDEWFPQFKIETAPDVKTRLNVWNPLSVVPNLHQMALLHQLIVE